MVSKWVELEKTIEGKTDDELVGWISNLRAEFQHAFMPNHTRETLRQMARICLREWTKREHMRVCPGCKHALPAEPILIEALVADLEAATPRPDWQHRARCRTRRKAGRVE